jgi:hypothetical protein
MLKGGRLQKPNKVRMSEEEKVQFRKLLKFEAVDLTKYGPDLFLDSDPEKQKLNGLIIAMATGFNDLVSFTWVDQIIQAVLPDAFGVTPFWGQCSGISIHNRRFAITVFYELVKMLQKNKDLIEHADFQEALLLTPTYVKPRWNAVLGHLDSSGPKKDKPLEARAVSFAADVRNAIAVHFYEPEIFYKGYQLWKDSIKPPNDHICASLGPHMLASRFYVSDGVTQAYMVDAFDRHGITEEDWIDFLVNFNVSLRMIINSYMEQESKRKELAVVRP